MAALQRAKQLLSAIVQTKGFDRVARKAEIVSFEEGKCLFKMNLGEEHVNKIGTLHGGLTATLIDTFTTFVLVTQPPHVPGVSVDLSISYLRPGKTGDEITINAEVVKLGRALAFTKAEVLDQDGKLIAHGNHTKYIGPGSAPVKTDI